MDRFDLGAHSRTVTTASAEAQRWFDLGLKWCFAFNHEEGVKCFERALEHDPECAMAHWGIAYALGPFYNYPWRHFGAEELAERTSVMHRHVAQARHHVERYPASPRTQVERALIGAMARRVQEPNAVEPDELDRWDDAYRDEMRKV